MSSKVSIEYSPAFSGERSEREHAMKESKTFHMRCFRAIASGASKQTTTRTNRLSSSNCDPKTLEGVC